MARDGKLTVTIPVTNVGKVTGDEIVQVYIRSLDNETAPIKELKGFQRLHLNAGEKQTAVVELTGESFQYYDEAIDELSTRAGKYQILYGPSSRAQDLRLAGEIVVK
jgi:beta-glucosidase